MMVMIMIIIIQSAIADTYKDTCDHCSNVSTSLAVKLSHENVFSGFNFIAA